MTGIGLPVPGFYTINCGVCNEYFNNGNQWPAGLKEENATCLEKLQDIMKKVFYNEEKMIKHFGADYTKMSDEEFMKKAVEVPPPMLVSVRSGAAQSMPGMMDTVLNLGLNPYTVKILLAKNPTNERFVMDSYRRFIMMFSDIVLNIDAKIFDTKLQEIKKKYGRA